MTMQRITVIGLSGSIRSNHNHFKTLNQMIVKAKDRAEFTTLLKNSDYVYSNTDIALSVALLGAKQNDADVKIISLTDLFRHRNEKLYENLTEMVTVNDIEELDTLSIDQEHLKNISNDINKADGIIMGTPVYFGDRSSVANKILQLTSIQNQLRNKAIGVVSVGAKRNGGQETAIIYTLYEVLMQGSIITGNGPKTAQYGGTVVAGDSGMAIEDNFGMDTSYGTGKQVSQLSKILKAGQEKSGGSPRVIFLLSMDTPEKKYNKILDEYISRQQELTNYETVDLTDKNIYRCIACNVCPSVTVKKRKESEVSPYTCVIQTEKDYMKELRLKLIDADVIIIVGVNSNENLTYRYQAFMERTRFIRREDFELTNKVITSLLINDVGSMHNPIFGVKVVTSFIRHNTFMTTPLQIMMHNNTIIREDSLDDSFPNFKQILNGRKMVQPIKVSYKATGYANKSLDNSETKRQ
ncbi:MAG: NAD(P)H-dependent oxidoreductase [Leptospirales bacterium]